MLLQNGQQGPASILRSRQSSLEKGLLPDASMGMSAGRFSQAASQYGGGGAGGGAGGTVDFSQMGRTRDSSNMDDVVDHVRSLNQVSSRLVSCFMQH